jgi:hypothetical protein
MLKLTLEWAKRKLILYSILLCTIAQIDKCWTGIQCKQSLLFQITSVIMVLKFGQLVTLHHAHFTLLNIKVLHYLVEHFKDSNFIETSNLFTVMCHRHFIFERQTHVHTHTHGEQQQLLLTFLHLEDPGFHCLFVFMWFLFLSYGII